MSGVASNLLFVLLFKIPKNWLEHSLSSSKRGANVQRIA